jgi:arylamine N-acetyltransferase
MDPETSIDLDAYFQRIDYDGERTPLLCQPVRLDLALLQDKLIHCGRGGYCFEQNLLLRGLARLGLSCDRAGRACTLERAGRGGHGARSYAAARRGRRAG